MQRGSLTRNPPQEGQIIYLIGNTVPKQCLCSLIGRGSSTNRDYENYAHVVAC